MADASYEPKIYIEQGAERLVAKSGGSIDIESGGEIDIESGASLKLAGTAVTATAAEINAIAGGGLSSAELGVLDGVTPGTVLASSAVVVDANKDITTFRNLNASGAINQTAGAAAAAVAQRFGATATEGMEIKVIDETVSGFTGAVSFDLTENIPAGAVILSVQANIETTVVAGGTSVGIAIGVASGDVDKYGEANALTQNTKIDAIPDWAVLSGAEDVQIGIIITDGGSLGDTNASAGAVRVRIVYLATNSLDDA